SSGRTVPPVIAPPWMPSARSGLTVIDQELVRTHSSSVMEPSITGGVLRGNATMVFVGSYVARSARHRGAVSVRSPNPNGSASHIQVGGKLRDMTRLGRAGFIVRRVSTVGSWFRRP